MYLTIKKVPFWFFSLNVTSKSQLREIKKMEAVEVVQQEAIVV